MSKIGLPLTTLSGEQGLATFQALAAASQSARDISGADNIVARIQTKGDK